MRRDESKIPNNIDSQDILLAAKAFDAGVDHGFHDSTKFDVIINNKRYPPKAIIGIASTTATGIRVVPKDFTGGLGSKCFRILEQLNFPIAPKTTFMETDAFVVGRTYNRRRDLHATYGGQQQGGISTPLYHAIHGRYGGTTWLQGRLDR